MIGLCRPKLLWGYPVPACCHGNAVWDLNTSLCPLPVSLSSSSFHSSRLPSCFLSLSVTLSRSISQSCFLWHCWGFSSSPCLVLSAKWHFTSCFFLLILCYFASHDSVKALVKYKVASPETQRRYLLYTHIITETFVDRCMYNYLQAHTNRSSHTELWVNDQNIHWMLAQRAPADSQLPVKIYHFLLKPHHQASFRHAGLPHSPPMHHQCQDTD